MKHIFSGLMMALMLAVPASATQFVSGFDDLPLMDGLYQTAEDLVVFDKPEGRIILAQAHGDVSFGDVVVFYSTTLRALGWQERHPQGGDATFVREGERLEIFVERRGADQAPVDVLFQLSPN